MPVTVQPSSVAASQWAREDHCLSATALLNEACPKLSKTCKELIQSSFNKFDPSSPLFASPNGFIRATISAYSNHHHLIIRPEDIWFAILTQLSLYINANSEELRSFFVAHEGKKELNIVAAGTVHSIDFGSLAARMGELIQENVVDPELRDWIMPKFSTTTDTDLVVASILMMGGLQKYFEYKVSLMCGLPSVSLLGSKEDWQNILGRIEKLPKLGTEPTQFYNLLKPVLTRFVRTFDEPDSDDTKDFWSKIVHESSGSGTHLISGWITAFCFWDEDGKSMYAPDGVKPSGDVTLGLYDRRSPGLCLDNTLYHRVEMEDIPDGFTSVPVKVDDNGVPLETTMVAGSVGIRVSTSASGTGPDSLQPESGWWMFTKQEVPDDADDDTNTSPPPMISGTSNTGENMPLEEILVEVVEV